MQKETVLERIKLKIDKEFSSQADAADFFGVTQANLSLAINGKRKEIPDYLLNWAGYMKTTTTTYYRAIK
jgi:predicted XRE-type DNA-binding protein